MICAVNVATWELFPMLLVKKLAVRPIKMLSLVTVEWYLRIAAMEEVITFSYMTHFMKHTAVLSIILDANLVLDCKTIV